MVDLSVSLSGWTLDNPVIPASGTFGYGEEFAKIYDLNILGSFVMKGTTREERFGNATPRIAECPAGMINAVGMQNPGIDKVIHEELPRMKTFFRKKAVANVGGFSVEEYAEVCAKLDGEDQVGLIELNVSCPNVHGGCLSFGAGADGIKAVVKAVKAVCSKPIYVKLSPNVTDIASLARACADAGADGISLINTLLGMRIDLKKKRPVLANTMGGVSGPAVFPIALRMVWQVYEAVKLPIIGMGGISTAEDVLEMMLAGATAVEVGAANLVDPWACPKIIDDLPHAMEKLGIRSLREIIGRAH